MTIGSTIPARVTFNCDGVSKVFPIPIQAYQASDITVVLTSPGSAGGTETLLVLNSDYSMVTAGTLAPPQWTLTTLAAAAYATGYTLQAFINPVQAQQTSYVQGQAFPSLAVQTNFDRLTQMVQRLQDQVSRTVLAPDGDVSPGMQLPAASLRALMYLAFDANGNVLPITALPGTANTAASLGPILNPRTPPEITAGVTPVNFVYLQGDIRRYGADATGVADSTAAIQRAVNVAQVVGPIVAGYANVDIPAGTFIVSSTINITHDYVRIRGVDRSVSTIWCATSGVGTIFNVNKPGSAIFGVVITDVEIFCQPGLAAPPVGFAFKDASECFLRYCRTENCKDGLLLNGINLCSFTDFEAGGTGTQNTAVHLTIQGTSVFFQNAINWMQNVDGFNNSVANILIGGPTYDLQIRASYGEECPYGVLVQNDSGVTALVVDRLYLDGVTFWSTSGESFAGGGYLAALPPAGSGSYLQMQNTVIANAFSNATNGQSFQILLRQNGNTNGLTFYSNTEILNGVFYGNCTSVLFSDATTSTGDMRGNIKASVAFQSGAAVPLRSGSGTIGWGTEESGNWTPTDASGASLAFTSVYGSWVRKGVMVTATFEVTYPTTANGSATLISGLPFNAIATAGRQQFGGPSSYSTFSAGVSGLINSGASTLALLGLTGGGAALTNANMSANDVRMTLTYPSQ